MMKQRIFPLLACLAMLWCPQLPAAAADDTDAGNIPVLQDYLLGRTSDLPNGLDLNADGVIDAFDLALMKRIKKADALEPKGTVHTGDATFYGGGYVGGCAMLDPVSTDYWIVAMNYYDWNGSQLAGAYLEVTGELGTIPMLVTDELPEGKKGDLDLCTDAFPLIAPVEKGRVPCSWRIIPLDAATGAPISFRYKEGSTQFWAGVQIRNHRWPVTKLEYLDSSGRFVEIPRRNYNYFESMDMGAGPFTFRITDIYGNALVEQNVPLTEPEVDLSGTVQFPE